MVIKHNIQAKTAQRHLSQNQGKMSGSLEKLSSGYKINRAADDASGLTTSEKMRCTVTGLKAATENCEAGINLVRVADGAIEEIHAMLNRMVDLSIQSANGTYDDEVDRSALQSEFQQLIDEIDRIVETTNFNGIPLLNRDAILIEGGIDDLVWDVIDPYGTKKTSTKTQDNTAEINSVVKNVTTDSSSYYQSSTIDIPSEALSVPADAQLPYEIEMIFTVYNDASSQIGSADIMNQVVTLIVDKDNSGNMSVIGKSSLVSPENLDSYDHNSVTGKSFYMTTYAQTNKDIANQAAGNDTTTYYVKEKTAGQALVTSTEMGYIMEDLLQSMPYGLTAGGYDTYTSDTTLYGRDTAMWNNAGFTYTGGKWTLPVDGPYAGWSTSAFSSAMYTSAQKGYGISGTSGTYSSTGNAYNSSLYIDGSSYSQTGRVLGAEICVYSQDVLIKEDQSPDGFDPTLWNSASNMLDLPANKVLPVKYFAIPDHTNITLDPDNFLTGSEILGLTEKELEDYIISISQVQETSTKPDEIDPEMITESYAIVFKPFLQEVEDKLLGLGVTDIVWADPGETHLAIDELCDLIVASPNFKCSYAARKLDDPNYDVSLDDNETTRYIIEMQTFTQYNYTYEPTMGWVPGKVEGDKTIPIIIQAGAQGEEFDRIYIYIDNMQNDVKTLESVNVAQQESAFETVEVLQEVINSASMNRSRIGAYENRLEVAANVDRTSRENLQAAESKIRDTDVAEEMMQYTAKQILIESSQAMLSHATSLPESVLSLLG